ncbi:MAG TPA: nitroreductase family protein [Thermoanaerobaculaceae bacterium]|nr:nitroreductase family protein [Thermoanaerobaculaceae bacterium]
MLRAYTRHAVVVIAVVVATAVQAAQLPPPIELPKPKLDNSTTLVQALKARRTGREFSTAPLPIQTLSDLLWAAFGVNRDDGRRTAPSAHNWQEIDIYVALPQGVYVFDGKAHALTGVVAGDLRAATGKQGFVKDAPATLVFVADLARMKDASPEDRDIYSATDAAFISQNVYLYCAAAGLATGVRGMVDRPALAKALGLRPEQRIVLAQSVGYPKQ